MTEHKAYKQLFKLGECIYIDVRIQIELCGLLENIICSERFIHLSPTLCHEVAPANDVVNGNDF